MAEKLSLYIVSIENHDGSLLTRHLIVAENAGQAEKAASDRSGYDDSLDDVGRLGPYDPGVSGHQLVTRMSKGLIVMTEETRVR